MLQETMGNSLYKVLLTNEHVAANRVYLKQSRNGGWDEYTWSQVMLQARKVAAFLLKFGLKRGSHVAIISKNCAQWFITDFGIHLAGMVNVPLFPNQSEKSIQYVLDHADIELVFIGKLDDHELMRSFIPEKYPTISFGYHLDLNVNHTWNDMQDIAPLMETSEPAAEDLYTIIYSSGTTGVPKGAMYTNNTIANYLTVLPLDLGRIRDLQHYKLVSYLPLAHVYERSAIQLASVMIDCDVSFIENLSHFSRNLQTIQPHFFTAVPRIWGVFQKRIEEKISPNLLKILLCIPLISFLIKKIIKKELGLAQCTNFFSGASPLPLATMKFFNKLGIKIQEGYGQTENLAYATLSLLSDRLEGYVGTPRVEVDIKLGEGRELLCRSPCLMSGYYKDDEATQKSLTDDGWLRTGDVVEITSDQQVKILGRISESFKNQTGEFVAPSPIEQLFDNDLIDQLCLVGQGLSGNVMLVSLTKEALTEKTQFEITKTLEDAISQVNNGLLSYEKISNVVVVKENWSTQNNLLTPTLKVKRHMVEQHYAPLIASVLVQSKRVVWEL